MHSLFVMRNILLLIIVLGFGRLMADVEYLYTNGVWTSFDKCRLTAEYLEREYLGVPCDYVHNPSHGRIRDSARAVLCWFGATHPIVGRHVRVPLVVVAGGGSELLCARFLFGGGIDSDCYPIVPLGRLILRKIRASQ